MAKVGKGKILTFHIYDLRFTIYELRFTFVVTWELQDAPTFNSRFTIHVCGNLGGCKTPLRI